MIANVSIWSSMKRKYALAVTKTIFKDIESPLYVLRLEQCNMIKLRNKHGELMNYKVKGIDKNIFFKPLDKLFELENSIIFFDNIIMVNDNLAKYIMNCPSNVILFESLSYEGDGALDGILIDHLLPWIQCLHLVRLESLYSYWLDNIIGWLSLIQEPIGKEYVELVEVVEECNRLYDEWVQSKT